MKVEKKRPFCISLQQHGSEEVEDVSAETRLQHILQIPVYLSLRRGVRNGTQRLWAHNYQHLRWFLKGWTSFHQKIVYLAQKNLEAAVYQKKTPYLARKKKGGSSLAKKIAYLAKNLFGGSSLAKKTPYLAKKNWRQSFSKKNCLLSPKKNLEAIVWQKKYLLSQKKLEAVVEQKKLLT